MAVNKLEFIPPFVLFIFEVYFKWILSWAVNQAVEQKNTCKDYSTSWAYIALPYQGKKVNSTVMNPVFGKMVFCAFSHKYCFNVCGLIIPSVTV